MSTSKNIQLKQVLLMLALFTFTRTTAQKPKELIPGKFPQTIPVLNMGTFHMSFTTDDHSYEFDEHSKENKRQVHEIAKKIAKFKPTVIIVEMPPKYDAGLLQEYQAYLKNPEMTFKQPSEIELLAYEVGRLSGTQKIYGIDYRESYNYNIVEKISPIPDSATYLQYAAMAEKYETAGVEKKLSLLNFFRLMNAPAYFDFMININADILTHVASGDKAQGADEAAKYYHRNLVMYSNLNKIPLKKEDRVFILMGASHTAYFNDFMRRSPKYKLVNVLDYLR